MKWFFPKFTSQRLYVYCNLMCDRSFANHFWREPQSVTSTDLIRWKPITSRLTETNVIYGVLSAWSVGLIF